MAARKTPPPRREPRPNKQTLGLPKKKLPGGPGTGDIAYAKTALQTSYGAGTTSYQGQTPDMKAVLDYYSSLPKGQRQAAYRTLASTIKNRDLSTWSGNPGQIAMFGEIDAGARAAYAKLDPYRNGTLSKSGGTATSTDGQSTSMFSTGVSGATGQFITEAGGGPAGLAAEGGATTKKKKKAQRKKLVRRVVKKTNVKGKAVRKALRSPGVTKADKRVYKKVAAQATPKLSSRLRVADRRKRK